LAIGVSGVTADSRNSDPKNRLPFAELDRLREPIVTIANGASASRLEFTAAILKSNSSPPGVHKARGSADSWPP